MHPLIVIVGPTASGKSALGLYLAAAFSGEIVNYDSVQIFRELNIGTAKPAPEERAQTPHHMIDIRDPVDVFTAGDYQREGREALRQIRDRGRVPILVGGTGLYLRALIDGLFSGPARSEHWRNRLEMIAERRGPAYIHRMLQRLDSAAASRIAARDRPKIIRALEVRFQTGRPLSEHLAAQPRQPLEGFEAIFIGVDPPRPELYRRIDERVVRMFEAGLVEEIREILAKGIPRSAKALEAIGYRRILTVLDAAMPLEETIRLIQRDTRRYAKRQMTWFRKQPNVQWFDGPGDVDDIKKKVHRFLQPLIRVARPQ